MDPFLLFQRRQVIYIVHFRQLFGKEIVSYSLLLSVSHRTIFLFLLSDNILCLSSVEILYASFPTLSFLRHYLWSQWNVIPNTTDRECRVYTLYRIHYIVKHLRGAASRLMPAYPCNIQAGHIALHTLI